MSRLIRGVILGYLTMAVVIFATFTGAYLALGADGAFEPGTYEVSTVWIVASIVLGLVAAVLGGFVCAAVARNRKAVLALAGLVFVLGIVFAIPVLTADYPGPAERTAEVGNMAAMKNARQPAWIALLNPLLGAVGVVLGGRLKGDTGT